MDAPTYAALSAVLIVELPSALSDAMREVERARMRAADAESGLHAREVHYMRILVSIRQELIVALDTYTPRTVMRAARWVVDIAMDALMRVRLSYADVEDTD